MIQENPSKGFVVVASQRIQFLMSAQNLAESILDYYPEAKITLFTEQKFIDDVETEQHTQAFELYLGLTGSATDFILGEQAFHITGNGPTGPTAPSIDNATGIGKVFEWNSKEDGLLIIGSMSGSFNVEIGEYIYGQSSDAVGVIESFGSLNLKIPTRPGTTEDLLDSLNLEKEKTDENLFDFTDKDPFSEGNYWCLDISTTSL